MKGGEKGIKRVLGKELMSTFQWGGMVENNKNDDKIDEIVKF